MTIEILLCITANFGHFLTFLLKPPQLFIHPAGRSLNLFWCERSNKSCHTEELLPAAILVITRVISMKIGLNVLNIRA